MPGISQLVSGKAEAQEQAFLKPLPGRSPLEVCGASAAAQVAQNQASVAVSSLLSSSRVAGLSRTL